MSDSWKETGTVGKALKIMDIVASFGEPVRFNDILAQSPFPKASTYRFLQSLTQEGMLAFNTSDNTYGLGMRLVRLAHVAWKQASLGPIAAPLLDKLSQKTGQTIHLAQLDHGQVLYVDKRNAKKPISMFSDAGKIGPAYCTGVGKAMLAFLPNAQLNVILEQQSFYKHTEHTITSKDALKAELKNIHETGISFDREEHEPRIICIAVPIKTHATHVIGGISITTSKEHMTLEQLEEFAPDLKATAAEIGDIAKNWQFPSS